MNEEIQQIFETQLQILPKEVVVFLSSASWNNSVDEISSQYNLSVDQAYALKQEVTLVLAGITHPDEFSVELAQETEIEGNILEALVASVENKIFAFIRPALNEFFEKEASENAENSMVQEKPRMQRPDVAPENLPTDETGESLLPPIPSKFGKEEAEIPTHPFEEKMKKVFTAGQQSMGELALETPAQKTPTPQTPKAQLSYQADPYRETIE